MKLFSFTSIGRSNHLLASVPFRSHLVSMPLRPVFPTSFHRRLFAASAGRCQICHLCMFSTTACRLYMSPNKVDDEGPCPVNNMFSNNSEHGNGNGSGNGKANANANGSMSSSSSRTVGRLTHVSAESGEAHMVSIADKAPSRRVARARCRVRFSNRGVLHLIREDQMRKGDVLGVARVAGIMAAKRTPDLIPLCHPIAITHVGMNLDLVDGGDGGSGSPSIEISATVSCDGKTGVEMEALTAASTAALSVYDMCKAVDKGMVVEDLRVVSKEK